MKLLEKDRVVARKAHVAAPRPVVAPRPVTKPAIAVRARVVSRPATRRHVRRDEVLNRVVAFAAILGVTYVGSTLAGYVMLERARQSARHADGRASFDRAEAQAARASIEALTNPTTLHAWADAQRVRSDPLRRRDDARREGERPCRPPLIEGGAPVGRPPRLARGKASQRIDEGLEWPSC